MLRNRSVATAGGLTLVVIAAVLLGGARLGAFGFGTHDSPTVDTPTTVRETQLGPDTAHTVVEGGATTLSTTARQSPTAGRVGRRDDDRRDRSERVESHDERDDDDD